RDRSPMVDVAKCMNLMVSEPYYLLHILAFFSYIPARCFVAEALTPLRSAHLFRREIQALLVLCVLVAVKVRRSESWEAFVEDALFYAKITLAGIALVMDYHLALWYAVAFLVIYAIAQQPACEGLGSTSCMTPLQLETLLTEGNSSKFWMVEFRSSSQSTCIRSSSFFPELSITFSNKNLSFGSVDLGLFPNAAEKFGIPSGKLLHQLPIYMLFRDGVEVSRLPEEDSGPSFFDAPLSKV
ncbi:hypothetical protein M569_01224, partial [Genlisea aurea]